MKKINIPLSNNPYKVIIGSDILESLGREIVSGKLPLNIFVVIDSNVRKYHFERIDSCLRSIASRLDYFVLPSGEKYKSSETLARIYNKLISSGFGRDSLMVAAGGGVTGDLTGFAAATFMRGIPYVQLPTTLLSAIDSSVGGKTGINFGKTKNVVGAFHQPALVMSELAFLKTLPASEMFCGLGEVLKYAFLKDRTFFNTIDRKAAELLEGDLKTLEEITAKCIQIKSSVVLCDEKEKGPRKILNLGHTFAHSYESLMNYSIKHGNAVLIGLACAVLLAEKYNLLSSADYLLFTGFLKKFNPGNSFKGLNREKLYNIMLRDKKNRNGRIKFVLPLTIGSAAIDFEAEKKDVIDVLYRVESFFS
ncbi:MAG: 3-dehydroquinate synthase [Syntrophothermus sp.]